MFYELKRSAVVYLMVYYQDESDDQNMTYKSAKSVCRRNHKPPKKVNEN